jgi:hypothetical protein
MNDGNATMIPVDLEKIVAATLKEVGKQQTLGKNEVKPADALPDAAALEVTGVGEVVKPTLPAADAAALEVKGVGEGAGSDAAALEGEGVGVKPTLPDVDNNAPVQGKMYDIEGASGTDTGTHKFKNLDEVNAARKLVERELLTELKVGGRRRSTRRRHKKSSKKSRRQSKKGGKKHRKRTSKKGGKGKKRSQRKH